MDIMAVVLNYFDSKNRIFRRKPINEYHLPAMRSNNSDKVNDHMVAFYYLYYSRNRFYIIQNLYPYLNRSKIVLRKHQYDWIQRVLLQKKDQWEYFFQLDICNYEEKLLKSSFFIHKNLLSFTFSIN